MEVRDVTSSYERIVAELEPILDSARAAAVAECADFPHVRDAIVRLFEIEETWQTPFRLLPLLIADGLAVNRADVQVVCTLSRVWWAGAEVFDDVADGDFDAAAAGLPPTTALIAGTVCLTLLPQAIIAKQPWPERIKTSLMRELLDSALHSADGQIADVSPDQTGAWAQTMRAYVGKTGAAYGRDAAMTAVLGGVADELITGWRTFGRLFGVVRQLANDRAALASPDGGGDLANGTCTLLVAHALESLDGADLEALQALRGQARNDPEARLRLRSLLTSAPIQAGYDQRLEMLRRKLTALWDTLIQESDTADLVRWMINHSVGAAQIGEEFAK